MAQDGDPKTTPEKSDETVKKLMVNEFEFINFKTGFATIGNLNEKISHLEGMT